MDDKLSNCPLFRFLDHTAKVSRFLSTRFNKQVQIIVQLSKYGFRFVTLAFKIGFIGLAIFFLFGAIRHYENFSFLLFFCIWTSFLASTTFMVCYNKTFAIPRNFARLKNRMIFHAKMNSASFPNSNSKEMQKQIRSTQNVGIKVDQFKQFERMSTPNFIMFILFHLERLYLMDQESTAQKHKIFVICFATPEYSLKGSHGKK